MKKERERERERQTDRKDREKERRKRRRDVTKRRETVMVTRRGDRKGKEGRDSERAGGREKERSCCEWSHTHTFVCICEFVHVCMHL